MAARVAVQQPVAVRHPQLFAEPALRYNAAQVSVEAVQAAAQVCAPPPPLVTLATPVQDAPVA